MEVRLEVIQAYISIMLSATNFLISGSSGIVRDFLNLSLPSGKKDPLDKDIYSFSPSSVIAFFLATSKKLFLPNSFFSAFSVSKLTILFTFRFVVWSKTLYILYKDFEKVYENAILGLFLGILAGKCHFSLIYQQEL